MKRLWRALFPKADREWCYVVIVKHSKDIDPGAMWIFDSVWAHETAALARSKVVLGWGHGAAVQKVCFNKLPYE